MGIPGLTRTLAREKQRKRAVNFSGYDIYIDGPALAYDICDKCMDRDGRGTSHNYSRYWAKAIDCIQAILDAYEPANTIRAVLFDGGYPEDKLAIKEARHTDNVQKLGRKPVCCSSMLSQVFALHFPSVPCVVGSEEADEAIVALILRDSLDDANIEDDSLLKQFGSSNDKCLIFSNDSDFYTFDYGSKAIGVVLLRDLDLGYGTDPINSYLKVTWVGEVQKKGLVPARVMHDSKLLAKPSILSDSSLVFTQDHLRMMPKSCSFIHLYRYSNKLLDFAPQFREYLVPCKSWMVGRTYRAIYYSRVLHLYLKATGTTTSSSTIVEIVRKGSGLSHEPLTISPNDLSIYQDKLDILKDPNLAVQDILTEIRTENKNDLAINSSYGANPYQIAAVEQYLRKIFKLPPAESVIEGFNTADLFSPYKPPREKLEDIAKRLDGRIELVQLFAKLATALMSLMLLTWGSGLDLYRGKFLLTISDIDFTEFCKYQHIYDQALKRSKTKLYI